MRLTSGELEAIRRQPGRSAVLFLTDRCPVGCAHCSVDSRRDSATITDFELFGEIVDWICEQESFEVVGITGGEPFVERRGLELASRAITDANKRLVVYTSGIWATRSDPPGWIAATLARCTTVYLSTDGFHAEAVPRARYVSAARAIARAGAWIVVQVVRVGDMLEQAEALLAEAFGDGWADYAEVRPNVPLARGRGASVFTRLPKTRGREFRPCTLVASPLLRYDGIVTACCNEQVIMGLGPARLRRQVRTKAELDAAVEDFSHDPLLRVIGGAGPAALTLHPKFAELADREYTSICQLCFEALGAERDDPLLEAMASVGESR